MFSLNGGDSGGCLLFLSSVQWQPITEAFHPGGGIKWSDCRPLLAKACRAQPAQHGSSSFSLWISAVINVPPSHRVKLHYCNEPFGCKIGRRARKIVIRVKTSKNNNNKASIRFSVSSEMLSKKQELLLTWEVDISLHLFVGLLNHAVGTQGRFLARMASPPRWDVPQCDKHRKTAVENHHLLQLDAARKKNSRHLVLLHQNSRPIKNISQIWTVCFYKCGKKYGRCFCQFLYTLIFCTIFPFTMCSLWFRLIKKCLHNLRINKPIVII